MYVQTLLRKSQKLVLRPNTFISFFLIYLSIGNKSFLPAIISIFLKYNINI